MEEESRRSRVWRRAGNGEYGGKQKIESMEEESRRSRVWRRQEESRRSRVWNNGTVTWAQQRGPLGVLPKAKRPGGAYETYFGRNVRPKQEIET